MSMKFHKKPFYQLDEVCERWSMSRRDLAAFAYAGDIVMSFMAPHLAVRIGEWDKSQGEQRVSIDRGVSNVHGLTELVGRDAWAILHAGRHDISELLANEGYFARLCTDDGTPATYAITDADLIVQGAEFERFEKVHCVGPELAQFPGGGGNGGASRRRGAPTTHDWDEFWIEVCCYNNSCGLPETQAQLVRTMQDWFQAEGMPTPDDSTLKKKFKRLWFKMAQEAQRKRA